MLKPSRARCNQDCERRGIFHPRSRFAWCAAVLAARAGQYQAACSGFHDAARLFNSAINALIAEPMQTDAERDLVKRQANALQEGVDAAKEYAKVVCPLSEEPTAGGSAAASTETDYDFAAKRDLQQAATTATSQYSEAARLYEAHDRAGACASARLSATSFARVVAALKAQPALESALANVAQLYANAAQAAEDRDTFYCTG